MFAVLSPVLRLASLGAVLAVAAAAFAALPPPSGDPILTISGKVREANSPWGAVFDRAALEALPRIEIRTTTPWTDGVQSFEGVLVRDVLAAAGGRGDTVKAVGRDEHAVEIPEIDFERYAVIVALRQNGAPLAQRDRGPLWIIYPLDSHRELQNGEFHDRMVWQLKELRIR